MALPNPVFQGVLPLLWLLLITKVALNRSRVRRQLGRDPVVIRPARMTTSPAGYIEMALATGSVLLSVDVLLNAIAPRFVADALAITALRESTTLGYLGLIALACGLIIAGVAVRQMDLSWRIGIDNERPGPLVSRGLYARVRHPIYSGMLIAVTGLAAVTADVLSLGVAAAAWIGIPIQARLEEGFLLSRHPHEYAAYLESTGRFWPRLGGKVR